MKTYVMTWQGGAKADPENTETEIQVHGPFANEYSAAEWGVHWQERNGDDPRWNTIQLSDGRASLEVVIREPAWLDAAA